MIAFLSDKHQQVIQAIKKTDDSILLVGGSQLIEFLSETRERNEFFDRLVIIDKSLSKGSEKEDFAFLKDYVASNSPSLELVLAIPRDRGSELADLFLEEFSAPMYTVVYLPKTTTVAILKELVSLSVLELKAKYFSLDSQEVKSSNSKKEDKPKKKGFFSALFRGGSSKKEKQVEKKKEEKQEVVKPTEPVPTPIVPSKESLFETPEVAVSTPVTLNIQNSINDLFGVSNSEATEEAELGGTDNLNFGDYGDSHYQTGYIEEDEPDEEDEQQVDTGWSSVDVKPVSDFTPISENTSSSNFSEFLSVLETPEEDEQKSGSVNSEIFSGSATKFPSDFDMLGITLVVGSESSKFIANFLKEEVGYVILDTKKTLGVGAYISEKDYIQSDGTDYVEGGNTYLLNVQTSELSFLISKYNGSNIIVNVSVSSLDEVLSRITGSYSLLTVFSGEVSGFENQLLELEGISPVSARKVVSGAAMVIGGITNEITSILDGAVFSKIDWKGCFK